MSVLAAGDQRPFQEWKTQRKKRWSSAGVMAVRTRAAVREWPGTGPVSVGCSRLIIYSSSFHSQEDSWDDMITLVSEQVFVALSSFNY